MATKIGDTALSFSCLYPLKNDVDKIFEKSHMFTQSPYKILQISAR